MSRTETNLYSAIEEVLRSSKEPVTNVEVFEVPSVQLYAESSNRVSDYLGNMWRKGLLLRYPAPRDGTSTARWMYKWKPQRPKKRVATNPIEAPAPHHYGVVELIEGTEDVMVNLPHIQIIVRRKDGAAAVK